MPKKSIFPVQNCHSPATELKREQSHKNKQAGRRTSHVRTDSLQSPSSEMSPLFFWFFTLARALALKGAGAGQLPARRSRGLKKLDFPKFSTSVPRLLQNFSVLATVHTVTCWVGLACQQRQLALITVALFGLFSVTEFSGRESATETEMLRRFLGITECPLSCSVTV